MFRCNRIRGRKWQLGQRVALALSAIFCGASLLVTEAKAVDLPWKSDETFTKTTFEEDVKVILKDILKRNGQEAFFRPGVEGLVTFEFSNMPLQAAFNKLLEEQGLSYEYMPNTKTVTLFKRGTQTSTEDIFTPKYSLLEEVLSALKRFNLLETDVTIYHDQATNSLFLKGDTVKVTNIKRLAERLDEAYNYKRENDLKGRQKDLEMKTMDTSIASVEIEVKVIPLRYASVGTSRTTFQGESVSLPGIIESLKAFVGGLEVRDERSDKTPNPQLDSAIVKAIATMGKPVVSIDQRTNSVIIQGTKEQIDHVAKVIEDLDKPVPLVEIEVMIVDASVDVTRQLGINWGFKGNFGDNATSLATPTDVISKGTVPPLVLTPNTLKAATTESMSATGIKATTTAATTAATNQSGVMQFFSQSGLGAGFIYQGARDVLDSTMTALANDGKLQTIASPRVVTLNNLSAQITNSINTNFIVTTGDGTKSDIKTVSSGISLDITPSVIFAQAGKGRMVRLAINATNSTPGTSGKDSIAINSQQVRTNVIIPEDGTFIMGGLFNTSRKEVEKGIPGLKEIPVLGALFRTNESQEQKQETIFLITPKIFNPHDIASNPQGKKAKAQLEWQRKLLNKEQDEIQTKSKLIHLPTVIAEEE